MNKKKIRVGVIFGGKSGEHEVSLTSASNVMDAMDKTKYEIVPIGIAKSGQWLSGPAVMKQLADTSQMPPKLADQAIVTVATDGAEMYGSERDKARDQQLGGAELDVVGAAEIFGQHMLGAGDDHTEELDHYGKQRIFNLGYYTWVEQQGVSIEAFDQRRKPEFWRNLRTLISQWDELIKDFNDRVKHA